METMKRMDKKSTADAVALQERVQQLEKELADLRASNELQTRESEERFRAVFYQSPVGLIVSRKRDGLIINVNDAFCRIVGALREALIGKSTITLGLWQDPADRAILTGLLEKDGHVWNQEVHFRTVAGKNLALLASVQPLTIGYEDCVLSFLLDVTELHQVRGLLRASQTMARTVLSIPAAAAYLIDRDGTLLDANETLARRCGKSRKEVIGQRIWALFPPDVANRRSAQFE